MVYNVTTYTLLHLFHCYLLSRVLSEVCNVLYLEHTCCNCLNYYLRSMYERGVHLIPSVHLM